MMIPSMTLAEENWDFRCPDKYGIQHNNCYQPLHHNQHHNHNYNYNHQCSQQQPIGIFPERLQSREEWKVAGRSKVASTPKFSKPLPQEPPMAPPRRSFAHQQQQFDHWYYEQQQPLPPSQPLQQQPSYGYYRDEACDRDHTNHPLQNSFPELYLKTVASGTLTPTDAVTGPTTMPTTTTDDNEQEKPTSKKKPIDLNVDTTKRQITVQSINVENRVWINIDTTETGLTLANKIHNIATYGTRKIVSITTTSGRTIPLDHRPVFGSWMDMDDFKNGEEWKVNWCERDKGFVDRFVSRFVQVSGSSRRK